MKRTIKNNREPRMAVCMFFIMIFSVMLQAGSTAKKIVTIKITPKFAQAKKGYLQQELEAEARRGYFFDFGDANERAQTFKIMAQSFNLPYGKNIDDYIQGLTEIAQQVTGSGQEGNRGTGLGTGTGLNGDGSGTGFQGNGGTGSGTGTGTGKNGQVGGDGSGGSQAGNGSQQGVETQLDQESFPVYEVLQPSLEEPKKEEKIVEKPVLKPFEYTLDVVALEKVTSEEKIASDKLLLETLIKLMQCSYSQDQTSVKNFWIDEHGISAEIPLAVTAQIATKLKTEPMRVVKPSDGFELVWFVIKDQLIGAVGLVEQYKKRAALRVLLGSEETDGTLKNFIDKELKSVALNGLYEKLIDPKQELLNQWIKLFEPCFFDASLIKSPKVRRMFETILVNIIVARRVALTGTSYGITSNDAVRRLLKDVIKPLLLLFKKEELKEVKDTTAPVKSGLMDDKKLLEQKQQKEEEQKRVKSVTLDKDYVIEMYDRFNRLRIYNEFQKMFAIAGSDAINQYHSKKDEMAKRTVYPLLIWLFNDNKIQSSKDFRDIVNKQALFELDTQEPEIKAILDNTDLWNAVFDYHMQENKKNRKKIDITVWINNECASLTKVDALIKVIQRMKNLVNEKAQGLLKTLEQELKEISISGDRVLSLLEQIMSTESSSGKLEPSVVLNIKKIIDTYKKANEKKAIVINFLNELKKKYTETKQPVTYMIFEFFKNTLKDPSIKAYQLPEIFYGLTRMPSDIISRLVKVLGRKTLFTDIISADDFNNYMVPYGLLLSAISETDNKFIELNNALYAMNAGVIKQQELYPECLKTTENKMLVTKGLYKDKLKGLIDALNQKDLQKARSEIEEYVKVDAINPTRDTKANTAFNELLKSFVANLAQQFMSNYSISVKVLNEGSGTCPDGFKNCLIAALPLSGVSEKEVKRNARIYQSFKGLLSEIVTALNPNNKPLDSVGLQNLNIESLKNLFAQFLEKVNKVFENKVFDKVWIVSNKQSEREQVLAAIKEYGDTLINNIAILKSQVSSSGQTIDQQMGIVGAGQFAPPPPPPPGQDGNSSFAPPPPPPPPGF